MSGDHTLLIMGGILLGLIIVYLILCKRKRNRLMNTIDSIVDNDEIELETMANQLNPQYGTLSTSCLTRTMPVTAEYDHLTNRENRCINNEVYESNNQGTRKLLLNTTYDNSSRNTYDTYDDTYYNTGDTSYTEYPDSVYYDVSQEY
jgi:hypothetical protein